MIQSLCGGHGWGEMVVLVVLLGVEFYLGKTRRTKCGSIIEIILSLFILLATLLSSFYKRGNKNE